MSIYDRMDAAGGDERAAEITKLRNELETERIRLAACGTAALGYFKGCAPEYDSASLQDVLRLYAKAYPPSTETALGD